MSDVLVGNDSSRLPAESNALNPLFTSLMSSDLMKCPSVTAVAVCEDAQMGAFRHTALIRGVPILLAVIRVFTVNRSDFGR